MLPKALGMNMKGKMDEYMPQISKLQFDRTLPDADNIRLHKWWAATFPKYPAIKNTITKCLSIFTGPRTEQSFSIMNSVLTKTMNQMK